MEMTKNRERLDKHSARQFWIDIFDPSTKVSVKRSSLEALEADMRRSSRRNGKPDERERSHYTAEMARLTRAYAEKVVARIDDEIIVAVVMTGGYDIGKEVFKASVNAGIASDFVLIGHSCRARSNIKLFSDGTEMEYDKLYIAGDHLDLLIANKDRRILIVDDMIETGLTIARIGEALKASIGTENGLMIMTALHVHMIGNRTWNGRTMDYERWWGNRAESFEAQVTSVKVGIVTEEGPIKSVART
ncbi:MAG: phosphoribosyltransferase [Candidatus Micrarchaeota archaeon]|nr:phosphoribosyltransferase [Candidatus Micrarchaeota archaeon]